MKEADGIHQATQRRGAMHVIGCKKKYNKQKKSRCTAIDFRGTVVQASIRLQCFLLKECLDGAYGLNMNAVGFCNHSFVIFIFTCHYLPVQDA